MACAMPEARSTSEAMCRTGGRRRNSSVLDAIECAEANLRTLERACGKNTQPEGEFAGLGTSRECAAGCARDEKYENNVKKCLKCMGARTLKRRRLWWRLHLVTNA